VAVKKQSPPLGRGSLFSLYQKIRGFDYFMVSPIILLAVSLIILLAASVLSLIQACLIESALRIESSVVVSVVASLLQAANIAAMAMIANTFFIMLLVFCFVAQRYRQVAKNQILKDIIIPVYQTGGIKLPNNRKVILANNERLSNANQT
jgi:hypothetical protein